MKSSTPKQDVPQKVVVKLQHEQKLSKSKKHVLQVPDKQQANQTKNFEDVKASSKIRKRKERQESVSSLNQDKKVIRSNSEERPPLLISTKDEKNNGMRRVSSSGDFSQTGGDDTVKSLIKKNEQLRTLKYDENDYDKARSFERFARAHNSRTKKYPVKRYKTRGPAKNKQKPDQDSKKNNNETASPLSSVHTNENATFEPKENAALKFLNLSTPQNDRSPSPTRTSTSPTLHFSSLYDQIDNSEPIVSQPVNQVSDDMETMPGQFIASNKMLSSPRNSIIATRRIYLDPNVPHATIIKVPSNPIDERIQKLAKQINCCKKKIIASEVEFEAKTGNKPTQFDKMNDGAIRKLYVELSKLKREQKNLTDTSGKGFTSRGLVTAVGQVGKCASLEDTVKEIEERLKIKREQASRDPGLETLNATQLVEEKVATQKALLFLESVHGRPQNKHDRDIVRPFYDRYRLLKQMLLKVSNMTSSGELATIDENEAMHFVTSTSSSNETESEKTETAKPVVEKPSKETVLSDNVQSLSKSELLQQMSVIMDEKRDLRIKIKEFEKSVQENLGRMLTKDDKKPAEELYISYKRIKGRLRLIEVLIGKC